MTAHVTRFYGRLDGAKRDALVRGALVAAEALGGLPAETGDDEGLRVNMLAAAWFYLRHGHLRVPQQHIEGLPGGDVQVNLGRWLKSLGQRPDRPEALVVRPRLALIGRASGAYWPHAEQCASLFGFLGPLAVRAPMPSMRALMAGYVARAYGDGLTDDQVRALYDNGFTGQVPGGLSKESRPGVDLRRNMAAAAEVYEHRE